MIISVTGFIGSGKDTIADYLVAAHGFKRESFAGALKDAVAHVFSWDRELLEGRSAEGRAWREKVDPWWANRLQMQQLTPRWVLQNWGTEVCRMGFHTDIWIASLENKLRKTNEDIVISDCRFPNELTMVKNLGGKTVRVKRGDEPKWYTSAKKVNSGMSRIGWSSGKDELEQQGIHPSEYAWIGNKFDVTISNDGSIDELYANTEELLILEIGNKISLSPA
jgi:hypothetical protein